MTIDSQSPDDPSAGGDAAAAKQTDHDTSRSSDGLSCRDTDFGIGGDRDWEADPLVGATVGDVRIEAIIGQGGMGRVYRGRQKAPSRLVAVKLIRPGPRSAVALARFTREAEVLGRLRHPGIAPIHSAGTFDGPGGPTPYFVMELVPDATSLVRFAERRQLSVADRLRLLAETCRAIGHGHAAGVVHRDLKPGNVLVGSDDRTRVIDFGVAKLADDLDADAAVTETGECVGTRQYMSPEQFAGGPVDARSDVYALGVILHELLTGRLPYDVSRRSLVDTARIVRETRPARLDLGSRGLDRSLVRGIDAIAARCLAKLPADRYVSATALADDLDGVLAGRPAEAQSIARRAAPLVLVAAITLVGLVTMAAAAWWPARSTPPVHQRVAFNLLDEGWRRHLVAMRDVEQYTERVAGATTFIRPTAPGREGVAVLRFDVPFAIQDATLQAGIIVWTTGDLFPYDPGARAGLDVSPDGQRWTTLAQLEAGRGGGDSQAREISTIVAGGTSVWVRARLTATEEWPGDGMIFAQFLRTDPNNPVPTLTLTMSGTHEAVSPAKDR